MSDVKPSMLRMLFGAPVPDSEAAVPAESEEIPPYPEEAAVASSPSTLRPECAADEGPPLRPAEEPESGGETAVPLESEEAVAMAKKTEPSEHPCYFNNNPPSCMNPEDNVVRSSDPLPRTRHAQQVTT